MCSWNGLAWKLRVRIHVESYGAFKDDMRIDLNSSDVIGGGLAADALEVVAGEIRRPFIDLIERLSVGRETDIDWWATPLAGRNTYACPLYLRLCQFVLSRHLMQMDKVDEIVTDSPALAGVITKFARQGVHVSVAGGIGRTSFFRWLRVLHRYAGALYHAICQILVARLVLPRRATMPDGSVVLVDTFLYADSFAGGKLHDRHYPGMTDYLDIAERSQVFFAPSYYRIRNYVRFFRELRRMRDNLILKEDVLNVGDYLFALGHPFRLCWPKGHIDFLDVDIGPLIREALAESFAGSGAIEGLLRYRFALRLKERGISLRRIIEWFENQEIDHGANAGWRTFFPDTPVIGYQGFLASRHYLCVFPTTREMSLRLIPNRVAVMGRGLVESVREFCPELMVDIAPSFRFESVWRDRIDEPDTDWFTILISLPILLEDSRTILRLAVQSAGSVREGKPWRFQVRAHPTWRRSDVVQMMAGLDVKFEVVEGAFETLLDRSDALITAASSTCAHAIARGVPVAIVGQRSGLVQNPIPVFADPSLWTVCYSGADLGQTLDRYADADLSEIAHRRDLGEKFRERTFEPVTQESVRHFLGFGDFDFSANRTPVAF